MHRTRPLNRTEILAHALLGLVLFTFVLFARDVGRLLELLVRKSASGGTVAWLFLLTLPPKLSIRLPDRACLLFAWDKMRLWLY